MGSEVLTIEQIESLARLPGRDQLHGQLVGVVASPITGLVRGLASMISGLAIQLKQIEEQGLVGNGESAEGGAQSAAPEPEPSANGDSANGEPEPSEAPGDPVA